jgi:hypothetical protein
MTGTAGTAIAVPAALGAAGSFRRNAANQAGTAAGPQVPAAASGREAGHTWAAR